MLLARQKKILDAYFADNGMYSALVYDELPQSVRDSLERVKNQETLWCDAERYLSNLSWQRQ